MLFDEHTVVSPLSQLLSLDVHVCEWRVSTGTRAIVIREDRLPRDMEYLDDGPSSLILFKTVIFVKTRFSEPERCSVGKLLALQV